MGGLDELNHILRTVVVPSSQLQLLHRGEGKRGRRKRGRRKRGMRKRGRRKRGRRKRGRRKRGRRKCYEMEEDEPETLQEPYQRQSPATVYTPNKR